MSDQEPLQTEAIPVVTPEQRALWAQLKKDRDQLCEQLTVLEQSHQDLNRFLSKARRHNLIACVLVVIFTAVGWLMDGSVWLRWYVLPITFACCALLQFGGRFLGRLMHNKISSLAVFLEQTDAQIEKGRPIFETDHPQSYLQP